MDVEPVRNEVLGHYSAWLDDPVGFRKLSLCERLRQWPCQYSLDSGFLECENGGRLTISLEASSSVIFLPTNLLDHSSVLLFGWLVTPGTTRGMLGDILGVINLGNLL